MSADARPTAPDGTPPGRWHIGTLSYTAGRLLWVATWVLLGGMCYNTLAYTLIPTVLPLTLKEMGTSNALIGLIVGSIPAAMNMVMNPVLSTWSDKFRSPFGRRIPFLLFATPFVTLFLLLVGWGPEVLAFLGPRFPWLQDGGSFAAILLICLFSVLFQFFSLIVGSVYCYLFPDVIPHHLMGRFMSFMKIASLAGGWLFNKFLMGMVGDHAGWVYTIVGVVYLVVFLGMCLFVKEGSYPPPEKITGDKSGVLAKTGHALSVYVRECFGHRFYVLLFLGTALTQASTVCRGLFNTLFATKELGLTTAQFGEVMAAGSLVSIVVLLFSGYIMDKLHPLRVFTLSGVLVILLNVYGYYYVTDYDTFYHVGVAIVIVYAVQGLSIIPMFAMLFPANRYGQFSSANALINSFLLIAANWGGGWAVDRFGYRFIFVWDFIFTCLATLLLVLVWVQFLRLGGDRNFRSPLDNPPQPDPKDAPTP
jgi:maltose/moltooligosaccharide transporter